MAPLTASASNKSFDDLEGDFYKKDICVRLIHSWEARNIKKGNVLMGVELLLIDCKAFIPANRLYRFKSVMKPNTVYKLSNFIVRPAKRLYRVASHAYGISFTDQTIFVEIDGCPLEIATQMFRIRDFQAFSDIADTATDLFDIVGHLRLINGEKLDAPATMSTPPAAGGPSKEMVVLHVQLENGETARVYLWADIAAAFRGRWNESVEKPSVLLATTLNPKTLGGAVTLSSTASTRLFFDADVDETSRFKARFGPNGEEAPTVNSSSSAVTKLETVTLDEIHQFIGTETPQTASFFTTVTITDVLREYGWYFIGCSGCGSKMDMSSTSLICIKSTCKKPTKVGLIRYRVEARVRDDIGGVATFVFFETVVEKFVGRKAADVMNGIRQDAPPIGIEDAPVPAPDCLEAMVGQRCKFQVKVDDFTFKAARKTITVSRIVPDGETKLGDGAEGAEEHSEETSTEKHSAATADGIASGDEESPETGDKSKQAGKRPRLN